MPNRCPNGCDHITENKANEDIAADSEPSLKEDPKVEKKDGCFGEVDSYLVEYLSNIKKLRGKWLAMSSSALQDCD